MSAFPVTSKKDGLEWTEDERDHFAEMLLVAIDSEPLPLVKMAKMYRKRSKATDTKKEIENALASVAESLAEINLGDLPSTTFRSVEVQDAEEILVSPDPEARVLAEEENLTIDIQIAGFLPGMRAGRLSVINDPTSTKVVSWRKDSVDSLPDRGESCESLHGKLLDSSGVSRRARPPTSCSIDPRSDPGRGRGLPLRSADHGDLQSAPQQQPRLSDAERIVG